MAALAEQAPNASPYDAGDKTAYSVQIMLPEGEEARLRAWARAAPGATWPSWGGHVTLINSFLPSRHIGLIEREIAEVVAEAAPFRLVFNHAVCVEHWRRPGVWTALLVHRGRAGRNHRALLRLQSALRIALAPLKHDLVPEVSRRPYLPHLMLTAGLPREEAEALAATANAARLRLAFTVTEISLLKFMSQDPARTIWKPCTRKPFLLGEGGPLEEIACVESLDG